MTNAKSVLYSPYGGFRLKATYQRNLFLANVVVIVVVAGVLASAHLWGIESKPPGRIIPTQPDVAVPLRPVAPPTIIRDIPAVKVVGPKHAVQEGSIWRPVADEIVVNESMVAADQEMFAGPEDGAAFDGVQGNSGDSGSVDGCIPPWDMFIPLEKQPEMVAGVVPPYPRIARRAGISGTVWIRALIGKKGKVRMAEVHKSSGSSLLDEAAVLGAYRNVFSPGIQNGRPVMVWVTYNVEFKLED